MKIVGKSMYEKSVLAMCDCGSHIMEFFVYKDYQGELKTGISYYGYFKDRRINYIDVWFKSNDCLEKICQFLSNENLFSTEGLVFDESVIENGRFEIVVDSELKYIYFNRYSKSRYKKGQKTTWDICIKDNNIPELVEGLLELINYLKENSSK